jgi:hypothetical protein
MRTVTFLGALFVCGAWAIGCKPILQNPRDPAVSSATTSSGVVLGGDGKDEEAERNYLQAEDKRRIEAEERAEEIQKRSATVDDGAGASGFAASFHAELVKVDDAVDGIRAELDKAPPGVRAHVEKELAEVAKKRAEADDLEKQLARPADDPEAAHGIQRSVLEDKAARLLRELSAKIAEARAEIPL